jgi:hypothetical protein
MDVLSAATLTMASLIRFGEADARLIARLTELALGVKWWGEIREFAISALRNVEGSAILESAARIAEESELPYCAYAGEILAERDLPRFRGLLERVSANWPQDAPYPAYEVRKLLRSRA